MIEREKFDMVIKGIECCLGDTRADLPNLCTICPYAHGSYATQTCGKKLREDTLALLKTQEPRVMTLEEIPERQETTCWLEWRDGDFYAAILYANDLKVDYMKFCTSCAFMKSEYGVTVRCWTARPDQATREATPWE